MHTGKGRSLFGPATRYHAQCSLDTPPAHAIMHSSHAPCNDFQFGLGLIGSVGLAFSSLQLGLQMGRVRPNKNESDRVNQLGSGQPSSVGSEYVGGFLLCEAICSIRTYLASSTRSDRFGSDASIRSGRVGSNPWVS